ncbi:FHF complex subunit HOOK-interacting protein 1A-like [Syngnathus typhle]|uniref:FHF complex subunit HOOK-interacting protein 1A-like n=1 Tax=Syngnathus typhle TaxID=161592 RepID=UPI002A6AD5F9|nr:FHF complex subunit HOOK-interacting protein 1A-like [Syngnathus typhle]XP_061131940.1 FHF complex subunit HOOK-interacting protein 1A-like [Syngnathus typhle]XP_061131949.1 FHF complex subunit HOOK-interacting protein 1A-like [Syngnathus typhle]XP_061131956.1 FHF complex subunit HOOK-interacting protein 1A-like [Syngnathus typhle]XP_061131966.1 FHF complex subunit HOOK-interacting protein 1A-like [Syngnathus typhle]XP_061131973.1 FHF complex subunit HOOK-interacting protein 1A-like [Syngna
MMTLAVAGGDRRKSLTLQGVDPETCMIVFKNHWAQVVKILEKHEPSRGSTSALSFLSGTTGSGGARLGSIPADEASAVQNYVEHMLFLLMEEEAGQGGAMGPILEFVVLEGVMERLFLWSLRRQFTEDMKLEQLRMYQMLLTQAHQPLLHHKPLLRPLMTLLASCGGAGADAGGRVEAELVLLLYQLCVALVKDPSVLELFFHTSEDQGAANFLLFSLLIPYTHRQGPVGQQAREALLLIMSLSPSEPRVAQHIAQNTYFCPVLATGLSGLYSSLPARLQVYSEDWHCLDQPDWQQVPALVHFLHSLGFCSAVTSVTHPSIRSQLLSYIHNGFLVPVLAPALHKLTVEEVMTTTAYLDLFLRSISEPALLQTFLSFILLHAHDNVHILDTLVSRVNTPFQLGTVSLSLFRTLIGLFCEDVMLQLVFRFLIACSHLSRKQRSSLKHKTWYSTSAASFLLLLPSWCPVRLPNTNLASEHIHWPKGADVSVADSVGYKRSSDFLMDVNYLHYLSDARQAIAASNRACRRWSAPYDGHNPPPFQNRSGTVDDTNEDDVERQLKSDSAAASPTSCSIDVISKSNQPGRANIALELEWDDLFAFDDPSSSIGISFPSLPPLPPRHIQEMQRSAIKLVQGAYVEENEFEEDVLVYDLVAQKDAKAAILERMMAANRRERGGRVSATTTGRTIHETVNCIMSSRRVSEEGGTEERQSEDLGRRRNEDINCIDVCNVNSAANAQNHSSLNRHPTDSLNLPNNKVPGDNDDFLSKYHELMRSLGAEPECDNIMDDISTFTKRIQNLKQKLVEEDCEDGEERDEEMIEEDEDEDGVRNEVPFTGPFISVLLSRLENLLENSIAVNLLVTGILAQLASYPQPLLRTFLLGTQTHQLAGVSTLYQVLVSLHNQIERYIQARPEYPALVRQAWRFLLAKDHDSKIQENLHSQSIEHPDRLLPNGSVRNSLAAPHLSLLPPCPTIPPQDKSRVFAIVLFAEFLKELAAIALEHSITLDWTTEE